MFDQLYQPPTEIMVLGCGCSIESEATAQVSHLFNITQVSDVHTMCGSRGGGGRGFGPPLKNHKNIGVLSNSGPDPLKVTKLPSQHSMLDHHQHTGETPFKWRFAGRPIMAGL